MYRKNEELQHMQSHERTIRWLELNIKSMVLYSPNIVYNGIHKKQEAKKHQ